MDNKQKYPKMMWFDYKQTGKVGGLRYVEVVGVNKSEYQYIYAYDYSGEELEVETALADKKRFYDSKEDFLKEVNNDNQI